PPPLLVFSNSCEAADGAPWEARYAGQVFGLGSAFLLAGVANYVGPFWVVHDAESFEFATVCYRHLAAGGRLGDALQAAPRAGAAPRGGRGRATSTRATRRPAPAPPARARSYGPHRRARSRGGIQPASTCRSAAACAARWSAWRRRRARSSGARPKWSGSTPR